MQLNLTGAELHNLVAKDGRLTVRSPLVSIKTPTAGTVYCASFTIETPSTTEPLHYLFEQSVTTSVVTLRVYTEEFFELFNVVIGAMPERPIITSAMVNGQLMISSPSFSNTMYGIVGGGLIPATKVASELDDTTALEVPVGYVCTFGDRTPIASNGFIYFNDPNTDPRTFVGENAFPIAGEIYDLFQGDAGTLYAFTSAATYKIPSDSLGKGQLIQPFISTLPALQTSKPRNAAASNGVVVALSKDGLIMVATGERLDLAPYKGNHVLSPDVVVDDYREFGQLFTVSNGFLLAFQGTEPFYINIDIKNGFRSTTWTANNTPLNVVGTLKTRGGEDLVVLDGNVCTMVGNGADLGVSSVSAVACLDVDVPIDKAGVVKSITVASNNISQLTNIRVGATSNGSSTPARTTDTIIGTSVWSLTARMTGRVTRATRQRVRQRTNDLQIEVGLDGAQMLLDGGDIEIAGQARGRRDKS